MQTPFNRGNWMSTGEASSSWHPSVDMTMIITYHFILGFTKKDQHTMWLLKKKVYIYLVCQFSNLNQSSQKKCINQKWKSVLKRGTEIFRHSSAYSAVAIRSQSKHSLGIRMSHLCQTWPAFGMKLHIIYISRGMSLRYASLHFANGWLSVLYEGFNICFVRNITFFDVWWFMT